MRPLSIKSPFISTPKKDNIFALQKFADIMSMMCRCYAWQGRLPYKRVQLCLWDNNRQIQNLKFVNSYNNLLFDCRD